MSAATHFWLRTLALVLAALAVGLSFSWDRGELANPELPGSPAETLVLSPQPTAITLGPVFASNSVAASQAPLSSLSGAADGPPEITGVAGRIPNDIEVLVRLPDGSSATLRRGQSAAGWTLVSAAIDRAVFERAGERRVAVLVAGS